MHTVYTASVCYVSTFFLLRPVLAGRLVCSIPVVGMVAPAKEHFATREKCSHRLCSLSLAARQEISFTDSS